MAKLPAIHLYPGDWLRDSISGCSLAAQGLWLRLMFIGHDSPVYGQIFACDLLDAKAAIARRCGCTLHEFETLFSELLAAGIPSIEDGFVVSRRMLRDASLRDVRAKAGRKGGKQKAKQNSSKPLANRLAKRKQNTEDENENEDANEDVFELFWNVFPERRKKSKGSARDAFKKAIAKLPAAAIVAAAQEYAASDEGLGEFAKMPSTWLNQECWLDDRNAWKNKNGQSTTRIAPHRHRG